MLNLCGLVITILGSIMVLLICCAAPGKRHIRTAKGHVSMTSKRRQQWQASKI
jgi:hypothetical protein